MAEPTIQRAPNGDAWIITDVPGLGPARITAGVDFLNIEGGPVYVNTSDPDRDVPGWTVNGKTYGKASVGVSAGTDRYGEVTRVDGSPWTGELTTAARIKIRAAVEDWAPGFLATDAAQILIRETRDRHVRINAGMVASQLADARRHVDELEKLAATIEREGRYRYVSPFEGLTYDYLHLRRQS